MTPTVTRPSLRELDPILGPILRRHDASDAVPAALAVAVGALHHRLPLGFTRLWLRSRGGTTRFGSITASHRTWTRRIATPARKRYVASSPGGAGVVDMRVRVARALVAHVLSPLPERHGVSAARQINARRVLAVVAVGVLDSLASERPMDTALVSTPSLSVELGLSEDGCRCALNACVDSGWLRVVTAPRGGSKRYRLVTRLTADLSETGWRYSDTVDALIDGSANPITELLRVAGHPALGYHHEGATAATKGWIYALADAADVPVATLGLSRRALKVARRLWLGVLSADLDATLIQDLDASARMSGAIERYASAQKERAERAAARTAEVTAVRERRRKIRKVVERLLTEHPAPKPQAPGTERDAFVAALHARLLEQPPPDEWRGDLAKILAARLVRRGYGQTNADRVARYVAGLDVTEAGAA